MRIVAYLYQDLTWETQLDSTIWGWEVDRVYQDLDWRRSQLAAMLADFQAETPDYLLVMRLEDLGESLSQVTENLVQLEGLGICLIAIEQDYQSPNFKLGQAKIEQNGAESTDSSQLLVLLDAIQAEQRSRRIRHGHAQNRIKRRPRRGKPPMAISGARTDT